MDTEEYSTGSTHLPHESDAGSLNFICVSIVTPRAHARSGVKQWVLSVSVSVCQSVIKILFLQAICK